MTQTSAHDTSGPQQFRVWGKDQLASGPINLPVLVDLVREKRITHDTWIFSNQRRAWEQAGFMEELRPLFQDLAHPKATEAINAIRGGVNPQILDQVKLLAGLTDQELLTFLQYMEILSFEPLAYAVRKGDHGDAMFLILEGEVRVRLDRNGRETILATLKAGDFFGEVSLLDQGPRSADVVVNERSTLLKISAASFARLRREAPALAEPFLYALSRSLVGRLRALNKRYQGSIQMLDSLDFA